MDWVKKSRLTLSTIRYLTSAQIAHRLQRRLRVGLRHLLRKRFTLPQIDPSASFHTFFQGLSDLSSESVLNTNWKYAVDNATDLENQKFSFLGVKKHYPDEIVWNDPSVSRLWLFNLHYFDWVCDLLVASVALHDRERYFMLFRNQVVSWLQANSLLTGDGWHPYTLSSRIVNWLQACDGFAQQIASDAEFSLLLRRSIYQQTRVLFGDLEFDVQGNHLLRNLKAIIWSGITFNGEEADSWLQQGLDMLKYQLSFQVLPDGGHYERSPYYHCVVLKDLLELAILLRRSRKMTLPWFDSILRNMTEFLIAILPDNGRIPLLKDSVLADAPHPNDLITALSLYFGDPYLKSNSTSGLYSTLLFGSIAADESTREATPKRIMPDVLPLEESGYLILRDNQAQHHLIYDYGNPCPDQLPAHAHADMFSYELILHGKPVVVDSGVYEYTEGHWRDFFRSTRAHNTVEVDGENQSEVWSSFRVGRRAKPLNIDLNQTEHATIVTGQHDGYTRLHTCVRHRRTLVHQKNRFWLIVDELIGRLPFIAASFIHFHPTCDVLHHDSLYEVVSAQNHVAWIAPFGMGQSRIVHAQDEPHIQGWYSERFGSLEPNSVLECSVQGSFHYVFGYVISTNVSSSVREIKQDRYNHHIFVEQNSESFSFILTSYAADQPLGT